MEFREIDKWLKQVFEYPVPEDYFRFFQKGDFTSTARLYYIIDQDSETIAEISDWYTYDNIISVYNNCCEEKMIEKYHLPFFDSCGCTVVIDCNPDGSSFGQVFMRTPTGYFDEDLQENVYLEFDYVADSFTEIFSNLKTVEELEEMGIE